MRGAVRTAGLVGRVKHRSRSVLHVSRKGLIPPAKGDDHERSILQIDHCPNPNRQKRF